MYRFLVMIVVTLWFGAIDSWSTTTGRVEYLPGFQGPLPFHLETGYVGVDENEDVQLFYYFIRSESDPEHDPLMLWITGGPGCSAISGLLYEIGPIQFEAVHYNGSLPTLILTPYSWTKMANIIFLDTPVGTGFSYARTTLSCHSTDIQLCDQAYEFMRKWLRIHPEFISNPFYVAGDSYSGNPVPIITQLISNGNEKGTEPYINLKGYVLGNPLTFPEEDNYKIRFANGMGLISDDLYKSLFHSCHGEYRSEYVNPNNLGCLQNLELYNEMGLKLPMFWNLIVVILFGQLQLNFLITSCLKRINLFLHFTVVLMDTNWFIIGLMMLVFKKHCISRSGDHDLIIPHQSTQAWVKELHYIVTDQWRSWKLHNQIAGYTESYSNKMTFATVKGGGHTAPEYKPEECFAMFKRWISHQPI